MNRRFDRRVVLTASAVVALCMSAAPHSRHRSQGEEHFLFSYFTGNGEDGLHLAHSRDGLTWAALQDGRSFLRPEVGSKLMRDPSILRGPDGVFHLVWTTGWWDHGIGYASSRDLVTWSAQRSIPIMAHEPTALNCWAPELFYDDAAKQFLILWSTTIPGRFPETAEGGDEGKGHRLNHRIYYVTTRDFRTFSETRLLYDGGFNVIDGIILKDGDRYVMIVKDETRHPVPKKHLRITTSHRATGPYGPASEPITPDWVEGPTALKLGAAWVVYYDEYTRKRYGAIRSTDLKTWEDISDRIRFPPGARHGTAFVVPADIALTLVKVRGAELRVQAGQMPGQRSDGRN